MSIEDTAARLQASALSEGIRNVSWLIPLSQAIHIVMIGVVFVSIVVIASRVLGWVRGDEPLERVWARFAPFLWTGLVVLTLTGVFQTMAEPVREVMAFSFRLKMLLLVIGIVSAALFGRSVRRVALSEGAKVRRAPMATRFASVATVLLWVTIIFLGRAIAYDTSVWGKWSTAVEQGGAAAK